MILHYRMIVERYLKSNEVVGSSVLICEIFSLFDGKITLTMMFGVTASKVLLILIVRCNTNYHHH